MSDNSSGDGDGGSANQGTYYHEYSGDNNIHKEKVVIPIEDLDGPGTYDVTIDYSLVLQGHSGEADLRFYARTTEEGDNWGLPNDVRIADWSIRSGDRAGSNVKTISLDVESGDAGIVLIGNLDNEQPGTSSIDAEVIVGCSHSEPEDKVNASASVFSYVPGLSENENEDGNDVYSAFPNQGPIPGLPIDEAFIGDKIDHRDGTHLAETVEEALNKQKTVEDMDGEFNQFRTKNTLEISFDSDGEQSISDGAEIEVSVNSQLPEAPDGSYLDFNIDVDIVQSSVSLLDPTNPESPSTTLVEENVNDHTNLSIIDLTQWENDRTQTAYAWPRYLNGTVDTFSYDGEEIEGVRVSTLWGTANPYTRDIAQATGPLPGSNPIIYSWIDMVVLADGTYGVIVRDAPTFPFHSLYTGPAEVPCEQYERADSGLEILYDTDATTDTEYKAAINEDNHKPWGQFFGAFDDNTTYVPYRTPKMRYMENYDNDSTGRVFGYQNELLVDHPMMVYGEDSDGAELSNDDVESLLDPQLTPYPDLYPYF